MYEYVSLTYRPGYATAFKGSFPEFRFLPRFAYIKKISLLCKLSIGTRSVTLYIGLNWLERCTGIAGPQVRFSSEDLILHFSQSFLHGRSKMVYAANSIKFVPKQRKMDKYERKMVAGGGDKN